jgi:hypothetical protein
VWTWPRTLGCSRLPNASCAIPSLVKSLFPVKEVSSDADNRRHWLKPRSACRIPGRRATARWGPTVRAMYLSGCGRGAAGRGFISRSSRRAARASSTSCSGRCCGRFRGRQSDSGAREPAFWDRCATSGALGSRSRPKGGLLDPPILHRDLPPGAPPRESGVAGRSSTTGPPWVRRRTMSAGSTPSHRAGRSSREREARRGAIARSRCSR